MTVPLGGGGGEKIVALGGGGEKTVALVDSGVGGLAVLEVLRQELPQVSTLYLADHAYAPYGPRAQDDLVARVTVLVRYLERQQVDLVVLACNTATVTSIETLRAGFPHLRFVGMEPAVKPAAQAVSSFVVLGTRCTVTNDRYRLLCERQAAHRRVWHVAAPELVEQVEAGDWDDVSALERLVGPAVEAGAEGIVIGCTHFSFLIPTMQRRWPRLQIFDGRHGTVRRARSLLGAVSGTPCQRYLTTGEAGAVRRFPLAWERIAI